MIARRTLVLMVAGTLGWSGTAIAQESAAVRDLRRAYEEFQLDSVVRRAQGLVDAGGLSRSDLAQVWELKAFAYAAMDSSERAVEAFRELIRIDPDREPSVLRVAPRITSLYASALGQVVVVRHLRADTASFVAGAGAFTVRFQLSRPAQVTARVVGAGLDTLIDSVATGGDASVRWNGMGHGGEPVPSGRYRIVIEAAAGRDAFEVVQQVEVVRGTVDTLPWLTRLEGYDLRPEYERPPRSAKPLVVTTLLFGLALGATSALENPSLGSASSTGVAAVGVAALIAGGAMSLRRPAPVRVEVNVLYNQLVRDQLARRNEDIARDNAQRRNQSLLTMTPVARVGP